MSANVTFNINAIDKTRATFAQVNQGLNKMGLSGNQAGKAMFALGKRMLGWAAVAAIVIGQFRKVWQNLDEIEKRAGVNQDAIQSWKVLKYEVSALGDVIDNVVLAAGATVTGLFQAMRYSIIELTKGTEAAFKDYTDRIDKANKAYQNTPEYIKDVTEAQKQRLAIEKEYALLIGREDAPQKIRRLEKEVSFAKLAYGRSKDSLEQEKNWIEVTKLRIELEKEKRSLEDGYLDAMSNAIDAENEVNNIYRNKLGTLSELNILREKEIKNLMQIDKIDTPEKLEKQMLLLKHITDIDKDRSKIMTKQLQIAEEVGSTIASGFEEAIISGGNLRDILKGILQDILRIIIRQTITNRIATGISGAITNAFGGTSTGSISTAGLEKKAAGGPVSSGSMYLVGERGPELFTSSQAGRIIPNHEMSNVAGGGSGQSFTFVYNVAAGVTKMELLGALKASEQSTISKIRSQRARSAQPFAMA